METKRSIFLVLGSVCLIFTNCSREVNENKTSQTNVIISQDTTKQIGEQVSSMTAINDYLSVQPETFIIDTKKDTLITCQQGTKIYFTANSLEFEDGSTPSEEVEVDIKEYHTLGDFIKNNLTTTSGNRILETGGMVHVSISSNGRKLKMKKDKEYALYFPRKGKRKNMKLFYGNHQANDQIDWVLAPATISTPAKPTIKSDSLQEESATFRFKLVKSKLEEKSDDLNWRFRRQEQTISDYFSANFTAPKRIAEDFCSLEEPITSFSFRLNPIGKIIEIEFPKEAFYDSKKHYSPNFEKIVSRFFHTMPLVDVNKIGNQNHGQKYWLNVIGIKLVDEEKYTKDFKERYASFRNEAITQMNNTELNYYVLTATKFGWINCDRFWNVQGEKTEFFVNTKSSNDTRIFVVFKNSNSILEATPINNKAAFANIPIGQPVKIIGISYDKGKPIMAVAETTINKTGFELNNFNDFTLAQLETEFSVMTR